jgi:hypothetical protein
MADWHPGPPVEARGREIARVFTVHGQYQPGLRQVILPTVAKTSSPQRALQGGCPG